MLYIHIPFCHSKCSYCDFYSMPGHSDAVSGYIDAVIAEAEMREEELANPCSTVYIGGGTPSSLPLRDIDRLITGISQHIDTTSLEEFTIEVNPEDITDDILRFYIDRGINRVSMGVQSLDSNQLKLIGRRHSRQRALNAIESLCWSGINFSCDLIYGLPGQSTESWRQSLTTLLDYSPNHFSAYLLSYEHGTRLYAMRQRGLVKDSPEEEIEEMYSDLCHISNQRGYDHYEISNFGRPQFHAVHNSRYWDYTPYTGLGASAHSFNGNARMFNPANIKEYIGKITSGATAFIVEHETDEERLNDHIITSLRTSTGLNIDKLSSHWRDYLMSVAKPMIANGRLRLDKSKLTIPEQHWLTADDIMRHLIKI